MTTQEKQAKIDRICKWMGWHSIDHLAPWYDQGGIVRGYRWQNASSDKPFDPFTYPSDTAVVMDEVVRQGGSYEITPYGAHVRLGELAHFKGERGYGKAWMEAFCNAVLAMIGRE